jgi:hypothetical protein
MVMENAQSTIHVIIILKQLSVKTVILVTDAEIITEQQLSREATLWITEM